MWEEDPRYQHANYQFTLTAVVVGTLVLAGLSWSLGDWWPLLNWLVLVAVLMGSWLAIVGCVWLLVRVFGRKSLKPVANHEQEPSAHRASSSNQLPPSP
jgi:outer membrane murein-binding lipoprotein Lpp